MSSFTEPLLVEITHRSSKGRVLATVHRPFFFYLTDLAGEWVVVPKGYDTDFASTPRLTWGIFPPLGPYAKAAVVHDYLCTHALILKPDGSTRKCTRLEGDQIFLKAMEILGVPKWKRRTMYAAVRFFALIKNYK